MITTMQRAKVADDLKLQREGVKDPIEAIPACDDQMGECIDGFARVVDHAEKLLFLLGLETITKNAIDDLAQCARRVVDHVAKLEIFTMNVGDHVDQAARQGESRTKRGGFGDRRLRRWELDGQGAKEVGAVVGDGHASVYVAKRTRARAFSGTANS